MARQAAEPHHGFRRASSALVSALGRLLVPDFADYCIVHLRADPENEVELDSPLTQRDPEPGDVNQVTFSSALEEVLASGEAALYERAAMPLVASLRREDALLRVVPKSAAWSILLLPLTTPGATLGVATIVRTGEGRAFSTNDHAFARRLGVCLGAALGGSVDDAARQPPVREALEVASSKEEFLALISHELRTPLQSILGWSGVLLRGFSRPDELHRGLEAIERNAKAQAKLIDDVLDLSMLRAGRIRLRRRLIRIDELLRDLIDTASVAADARELLLELNVAEGVATEGDEDRLRQVIWHLLSNAIKFTPGGGHVRVSAELEAGQLTICVSDSGKGMSPELLSTAFDGFIQHDSGTTRTSSGLGLGLALCRHLVELHGGSLDATSDGEDQGTAFVLRLPVRSTRAVRSRDSTPDGERYLLGTRILVVDDDSDARELLAIVLERAGATVLTADSAFSARELLHGTEVDLLVSDISMPEEDGYSLLRYIRSLPESHPLQSVPAIAVTARTTGNDARAVVEAGFHAHLPKPVDSRRLVAEAFRLSVDSRQHDVR